MKIMAWIWSVWTLILVASCFAIGWSTSTVIILFNTTLSALMAVHSWLEVRNFAKQESIGDRKISYEDARRARDKSRSKRGGAE